MYATFIGLALYCILEEVRATTETLWSGADDTEPRFSEEKQCTLRSKPVKNVLSTDRASTTGVTGQ